MHPFAGLGVPGGHVGVHWFEQNSFAVRDPRGTIALVDPYFPRVRPTGTFLRATPPLREEELPTDLVLLTHDHDDHTNTETVGRIRSAWPAAKFVGPAESVRRIREEAGVRAERAIAIAPGETIALGDLTIRALWSKPPDGDARAGIPRPDTTHLGYVVGMGGNARSTAPEGIRLYFSGDLINNFAERDDLIAPLAAAAPHIGFLVTHPTEGEFPLFEGSVKMARRIGLRHAVPAHYECFVQRTYDPRAWAAHFREGDPAPLVIPWNSHVIYP
jgi:L-ascorbate metabolism protein UlaG (beta-lactamase superfamily)